MITLASFRGALVPQQRKPSEPSNTARPFYIAKAQALFASVGWEPGDAYLLAKWAQEGKDRSNPRIGAVVAEDGRIIARTHLDPWGVRLIHPEDAERLGLRSNVLTRELGMIADLFNLAVHHFTMRELTTGLVLIAPAVAGDQT